MLRMSLFVSKSDIRKLYSLEVQMSVAELIESWGNGWSFSVAEPTVDESGNTWIEVKFSKPTQTHPIPAHFIRTRFRIENGEPAGYYVEFDRQEKPINEHLTDQTLQIYLRMKEKCGKRSADLGLHP